MVPIEELIQSLINLNQSLLERFIDLLRQLQTHLTEGSPELQGQVEELLRLIIQIVQKSIESILKLQEQLQQSIVESFFPAQD